LPSPGASGLTVQWQLQSSWPDGYVAQLVVTATTQAVDQWSVSWPDPHAQSIVSAWGMDCTVSAGRVDCRGAGWASHILPGHSVTVGAQVAGDGIAPVAPVLVVG
jgi:endoglucanase